MKFLFEDDAVWVIDKPAGIPSVKFPHSKIESIADLILQLSPSQATIGSPQDCGVVHRLDNDTSGCLVVAKTPEAYAHLREQFEAASIYKEYAALVVGNPISKGTVDTPITHSEKSNKRMRCARAGETGQAAHTEWKVQRQFFTSRFGPLGYALLHIRISTGVRHQIRVHMASMGHPLVGDTLYQSQQLRSCDKLDAPHHLLHASRITIVSPASGQTIQCEAPLPKAFKRNLNILDETAKRR